MTAAETPASFEARRKRGSHLKMTAKTPGDKISSVEVSFGATCENGDSVE